MADEEWLKLHAPIQPKRKPTPGEHVVGTYAYQSAPVTGLRKRKRR